MKLLGERHKHYAPLIILALASAFFAVVWNGGEYLIKKLSSLEVRQPTKIKNPAPTLNPKDFYAIWIKEMGKQKNAEGDISSIFLKEEQAQKKTPLESIEKSDPLEVFEKIVLKGVADDGVFVGRHFYRVGQRLEEVPIETGLGQISTPVLVAVGTDTAIFDVGGRKVTLQLHSRGHESEKAQNAIGRTIGLTHTYPLTDPRSAH